MALQEVGNFLQQLAMLTRRSGTVFAIDWSSRPSGRRAPRSRVVVVGLSSLSPAQYIARTVWPYQRRPNVASRQRLQSMPPRSRTAVGASSSSYSSMATNCWMGAVRSHQRKQCRFNLRRLSQNALVRARGGCSARSQPRRIGTVVRWLPALIVTSRSGL
jgi:hypothetical protein